MPHLILRLGAVFAGATLVWVAVDRSADAIFGPDYQRGRHVFSAVAITALVVPLVVFAYRRLDRLQWSDLRRGSPWAAGQLLGLGAAGYLIPAGLAVTVLAATGTLEVAPRGSLLAIVGSVLFLAVLVLLYEALPEELVFRGYLYRNLTTALPRWVAVLAQAVLFVLFGMAVGAAGTVDRVVLLFGFAVVQGTIRAVTDTLWMPVGFHLAFQTTEQLVGPSWNRFVVNDLVVLQDLALGLVPLALGVPVVLLLRRAVPRRVPHDSARGR